ncbi:MAG: Holliday junction resolvase RuvX [Patescibacteria group bacterium]|nr:Holliday junction resolvase RuvX [Patescibacteria group bacterium]
MTIDLGEKRIGVALSDQKGIIAQPHTIIIRKSDTFALEQISEICKKNNVEKIVMGIPTSANEQTLKRFHSFSKKMSKVTSLDVQLWDETFSTKQAQNMVAFSDPAPLKKQTEEHRDDVAAAIILQEYLDNEKKS